VTPFFYPLLHLPHKRKLTWLGRLLVRQAGISMGKEQANSQMDASSPAIRAIMSPRRGAHLTP
jgi:hypothetical protein